MLKKFNAAFWKKFFAVIAVAGIAVGIIGFGAISLGLMPISARAPHLAITTTLLHYTFKRSTANDASALPTTTAWRIASASVEPTRAR